MIERLKHFKDFKKKVKMQDAVILGKKEILFQACKTSLSDEVKEALSKDVEQAERVKNEIILDEIRESQELKQLLKEHIHAERIRTIMIFHYIQGKTLKELTKANKEFALSYDYILKLNTRGMKILGQVVEL